LTSTIFWLDIWLSGTFLSSYTHYKCHFIFQKLHFDMFIHSYATSIATGFPTEYNILSKRLCKICKIKPPYLNFQWLIGPSSIYVAKQQRTKWNHPKNYFLTFQWLCWIWYLHVYKQFLRLGQNRPLS
jgi:hypothetical protein